MQIALSTEYVVKLLHLCQPDKYEISQCSFNLHFCCDEPSRASFHRCKRYLHFFSVNCLFISLDHFFLYGCCCVFFSILFLEAHYLFVCGINCRYFFPNESLALPFFFFLTSKSILFSSGLIYQSFVFFGSGF